MKRRKSLTILILLVIVFCCVFTIQFPVVSNSEVGFDERLAESIEQEKSAIDKMADSISEDDLIFVTPYGTLREIAYHEYEEMFFYVRFIIKNNLSADEIAYINSLLSEGYRLKLINSVYDFWLTTNEDITFIGKCLAVSDKFWGEYWIENAFNYLTSNKCGVLKTREEIEYYLNLGLTTGDISNANVLCRKGVYTIQEILGMRLNGESWVGICEKISPDDVYKYSEDVNEISVLHIENDNQIKNLMEKLNISDKKEITEKIRVAKDEIETYIDEKVSEKLSSLNVVCNERISKEELKEEENLKAKAIENGVSMDNFKLLLERGYSYSEISEISNLMSSRGASALDALNMYDGGER